MFYHQVWEWDLIDFKIFDLSARVLNIYKNRAWILIIFQMINFKRFIKHLVTFISFNLIKGVFELGI